MNASFVYAQVVFILSSFWLVFVESILDSWCHNGKKKKNDNSNTAAITVAFRSHISLFLLLSFLWVLFLTP